jgi:CRISPR-associated protein Cas1
VVEDSCLPFVLDIADLYRHDVTLDIPFSAAKEAATAGAPIDRRVRRRAPRLFRQHAVIPSMIDRIKSLLGIDGDAAAGPGNAA